MIAMNSNWLVMNRINRTMLNTNENRQLPRKTVTSGKDHKILKTARRIATTNWVHLLGFYVTTYLSIILFTVTGLERYQGGNWISILLLSLISIPFLFFTYGLLYVVYFFALIIIMDILGFSWTKWKPIQILLLEWLIIVPPFIYRAFKYDYWLWLTLSVSFFLTQLYRRRQVEKIKRRAGFGKGVVI